MDCNSIIYDSLRQIEKTEPSEKQIIDAVIAKIWSYIYTICPTNVLYIAFDGVAPFAKMEQQRTRRYKTGYLSKIDFDGGDASKSVKMGWSTSSITPGTPFMDALSARVNQEFAHSVKGVRTVVVSAADKAGEGEHKMFQYMRENALQNETIAVYGLDSDLIMLSLFHCFACDNIYIFREAPAFGKLAEGKFQQDELIYLNHRSLSKAILREMGVDTTTEEGARSRIYDYIFMCFLLGNDFLPHFPSLNIRTHGNTTLLETYKRIIGRFTDRRFIGLETGAIQWRWVRAFLTELAKMEPRSFVEEYESRRKMETRFYPTTKKEEREVAFDNIPVIYRAEEHFINPGESGWEARYYSVAFHDQVDGKQFVDKVCHNYLEGLEWVFKYYTEGCPHWRWKYEYSYPPLFRDLVERVPQFETTFIDERAGINRPFHPYTQLCYVVPKWNHDQVLSKRAKSLIKKYDAYYKDVDSLEFQWMFCRYFWEAHVVLPDMPIQLLEEIDASFSGKPLSTKT
jgi:5'-3' exonuclease